MVFPVVMYGCESWTMKKPEHWRIDAFFFNWCFWTVVLGNTLEISLDCKEIQPIHPKGNQSWVFIGRTDFEAETPILWLPDAKGWLIWKDPDAGKDWGQEKRTTRIRGLDGITGLMDMGLSGLQELVMDREAWHAVVIGSQRVGHNWVTELNWTDRERSKKMTEYMTWKLWEGGRHKAKTPAFILCFVQPQGPKKRHEGAISVARRKVKAKKMGLLALVPALVHPHSTQVLRVLKDLVWKKREGAALL